MVTKTELRKLMRIPKGDYSAEDESSVSLLLAFPLLWEADRLFLFVPLPSEVDITPLFSRYPFALPKCGKDGLMNFIAMGKDWKGKVRKTSLGIWEPTEGEKALPTGKSVILVPGLAFSSDGDRLGRGGGYYDHYLSMHPQAYAIGVCRKRQVADIIPMEAHDRKVNAVLAGGMWLKAPSTTMRNGIRPSP